MTVTTGSQSSAAARPPWRWRRMTDAGVVLAAVALVAGTAAGIMLGRDVVPQPSTVPDLPWLADLDAGQALQVNPGTGRVETRITVADRGTPFRLAQSPGHLVVTAGDGRLSIIDLATLAPSGGFQGLAGTKALVDDTSVYAADLGAGTVARIDPTTGAIRGTWSTDLALADAALDEQGMVWALRADGRLHRLTFGEGSLNDAAAPVAMGGAGPAARLVAHPRGVTVIAPDAGPGSGLAAPIGTSTDGTTSVPGLTGAVAPARSAPADFIPVSLLDRPTVLLVGPGGVSTVDMRNVGCPRPGQPVIHRELAWFPCLGAGRVIALSRHGGHETPDIVLAEGSDAALTVHAGHLFATGPDGAGTGVTPGGERIIVTGLGGDAGPSPSLPADPRPSTGPAVPGSRPQPVPTATLACTSASGQFSCDVLVSPSGAAITWTRDGTRQAAWDGDTTVAGACTPSTTIGVTATNASGSDTASWSGCVPPPPPPAVSLSCTSADNQFDCEAAAIPAGVQLRWYRNGTHQALSDGVPTFAGACTASTVISVTATNVSGSDTQSWSSCAETPPTASAACESGSNQWRCDLTYSPASATVWWYINGSHVPSLDGEVGFTIGCAVGDTISVTVFNSAGSDTDFGGGCRDLPWQ